MYKELDDREILYMICESEDYYELMIEKYKPIVIGLSKKYLYLAKNIGYEFEDLIQIGNMAIFEAIKYFQDNKRVLFYTYVVKCIENKIKTEIRSQTTNKKKVLNESTSYDRKIPGTNEDLINFFEDENTLNPIDEVIKKENEINYINFINSLPFEVAVVYEMRNEGFTTKEIAKFMNIDSKSVLKDIQFAKNRLCLN